VAIGALSIDMSLPSLPAVGAALGASAATVQLTVTLFLAAFAVAQLVYGPVSDRFGRRRALVGGLALYAAGGLAAWAAPSVGTLVAGRIVQALGAGAGPVVGRAIVRDLYPPQRAARILGYMGTAQALTPILAPVLGGWVHVALGWRAVFLVLAGFGAVFTAAALGIVPETNVLRDAEALRPARLAANAAALLGDRTFTGYVLVVSLMFGGQFAFISGSAFVLIEVLGVAPDVYGLCFALVAFGIMTGSFLAGRLAARAGIDRLIAAGTALGAAAGALMAALAWAGRWTVPAVIGPMYAFAVGVGLVLPAGIAGAIGPFPRMAGLASALLGFCQMTGSALYGTLVGRLYDGTPRPMASAIALAGIAALGSLWTLAGRRPGRARG
jgi:DHA1 family bicyclomycin/chloramphenicol resistance-like MFS transporter